MSHQVLARKWRPQTFTELIGQDSTLAGLVHSLNKNQLHHAYLFTGTRGVGKTSIARIMAKCLNCEQGISSQPCGTCSACIEIPEGRFMDLIEIDAASRTKVEDTREILDNIQYAPTSGRFKVYLIDEVHMLSTHSFNALLKTLEEPPSHVKFLLATTDPQKLPVTVLSRCLQFHLKPIPQNLIIERLQFILKAENISHEEPALSLIAKAAEGSLRDALSLLDQTISQGEGSVTYETTTTMLGLTSIETLYSLAEIIAKQEINSLQAILKSLESLTLDYSSMLSLFAELWYEVSFKQAYPAYQSENWNNDILVKLADLSSPTLIQLFYQMAIQGRKDLALSPQPIIGFNMTLLRMLAFSPSASLPPSTSKQSSPTQELRLQEASQALQPSADTPQKENFLPHHKTLTPPPLAEKSLPLNLNKSAANPNFHENSATYWENLLNQLPLGNFMKQLVRHMRFDQAAANTLYLTLASEHQGLLTEKRIQELENLLSEAHQRPISLQISVSPHPIISPASQSEAALEIAKKRLQDKLAEDPHLAFIKNNFNAKVSEVKSNQNISIT